MTLKYQETIEKLRPMKGELFLMVCKRSGSVYLSYDKNLIVNTGYVAAAECLAGVSGAEISSLGMGSSWTAPDVTDTTLQNIVTVPLTSVTYPEPGSVRFNFEVGYDDANGLTIFEFGLVTADGRLFSRVTRSDYIEKSDEVMLVGYWQINV